MTELEKIAYARSFIDKLANGINPIDGSAIPEGDVVNNVRLSRCFFYVSDVLRQVVENGGITPAPVAVKVSKPKKTSFSLTPEQRESFNYSTTPITATEIVNRIIAAGPTEGVKKFPRKNLTMWLVSLGMLEEVYQNGSRAKRPTALGAEMGIALVEREGQYGIYTTVVYDENAQHFIIDNIDAVVALDKDLYRQNANLDNQGKPWTDEEDDLVVEMFGGGSTVGEIATALKRGHSAVMMRLRKHGFDPYAIAEESRTNKS